MPGVTNRPSMAALLAQLAGLDLTSYNEGTDADPEYPALEAILAASSDWVATEANTSFDPVLLVDERYDGNSTNQLMLRQRPVLEVKSLAVETPILGYVRVYTPDEIKLYRAEGVVKVFTYKLAAEQAMMMTLDYQAWGTIFPPLPQAVKLTYSYGFPLYDPVADATSLDGTTWVPGDHRVAVEQRWLATLQLAATADAAASFLGQTHGLAIGVVQSVSFDGFSQSFSAAGLAPQAQAFAATRDRLLKRRKRSYYMSTTA